MSEFLVVTGLSGAGRSTCAAALEDAGWFVIDNLPVELITKVAELVGKPGSGTDRVALVIGRGGGEQVELEDVRPVLDALRESHRVQVLFLDAPDDVLVRRFEGTRRRHPMGARGVEESIGDERRLLEGLRSEADILIDTGELNVNQLRTRVRELFTSETGPQMQTSIVSFGYKHGIPLDVDLVFDCRFLPNPYWLDELRDRSGRDQVVRDYVFGQPETGVFLGKVVDLVVMLIPAFVREGKSYLTVALGCTGGRHRSVVLADALADELVGGGVKATVFHRDIDR